MNTATPAEAPLQVTLYSKPGCHLCDDLHSLLDDLHGAISFTLVERNIEDDAGDLARYRDLIPVLEISGAGLLYPPHDAQTVRQALAAAAQAAR